MVAIPFGQRRAMNAMVNNIWCWHRRVFFSILVRTGGGTHKKYTVRRTILGLYQVYSKGWGLLRTKNREHTNSLKGL
jgi:hypothetical protein